MSTYVSQNFKNYLEIIKCTKCLQSSRHCFVSWYIFSVSNLNSFCVDFSTHIMVREC